MCLAIIVLHHRNMLHVCSGDISYTFVDLSSWNATHGFPVNASSCYQENSRAATALCTNVCTVCIPGDHHTYVANVTRPNISSTLA